MIRIVTSPRQFADWFNFKVPGAHRQISVDAVRDMTTCGLIGKHSGWYPHLDLETVRAILQYEQLRQNRQKRDEIKDSEGIIHCRGCGAVLDKPDDKRGRPREYCPECEPFRGRERNRKWRKERQTLAIEILPPLLR